MISCQADFPDRVIGVKIYNYEGDFETLFDSMSNLGINHVFTSPELAREEGFMKLARNRGMRIYLIVPTFFRPSLLERDEGLYSITSQGEKAREDWVQFMCPNRDDIRKLHIQYLRALVQDLHPDGISIDFIRYFVYWEKVYPDMTIDQMPMTCFDQACVDKFKDDYDISIDDDPADIASIAGIILKDYSDQWTSFKCNTISGFVKEMDEAINGIDPTVKLNLHAVPWSIYDYDHAITRVAGQDIEDLANLVDFVSPMCYSHMLKREPAWIHEVTESFNDLSGQENILPSIQVSKAYLDAALTVEEFRECLEASLLPPSKGVIFWSWDALSASHEKCQVVKTITSGM